MVGAIQQQRGGTLLTLKAPAKINLVLEVLGKRKDGYHDIKSIIQTVSLFDVLSFEKADDIELSCNAKELQSEDNLVFKAAVILKKMSGYASGVKIYLEKQIPWAAGLGGGSSDAAVTLTGLNRLWSLGMTREKLAEVAALIGSDVPFFLYGGTCQAEGRGETLIKLPDIEENWFVLVKPSLLVHPGKTSRLYGLIGPGQYTKGEYTDRMRQSISAMGKADQIYLHNVFDSVSSIAYPGLERYRSIFRSAGAEGIHLAGSGPVLFTGVRDQKSAAEIQDKLRVHDIQSFLVSSLPGGEIGY